MNRRHLLTQLASAAALPALGLRAASDPSPAPVRHSVCRGPFSKIPMDEFCEACKGMGIGSIELLEPTDFPSLQRHGLDCALVRFTSKELPGPHIVAGWNQPELHPILLRGYEKLIRQTADAGFQRVICFSGSRNGMDEATGIENCSAGLSQLMPLCEKLGVTLIMELLNSKVNHPDYMADHSAFGIALREKIGSPHFSLLYDIYHMQIMEGDIIATIREHHAHFGHYHTAGVPGRHEIDDSQELNYPAIVRAIQATGYTGWIGQEFSPTAKDKLASLRQAIQICTPSA
ncbi:MAG: TIM barrel protein [Verrucomicrobiales bacterium]|nr:TIM barrel protein [Verrucomicrobiales bacterium]